MGNNAKKEEAKIEKIHCTKCKKTIEKDAGRYNTADGSICVQCYNQNSGIILGQAAPKNIGEQGGKNAETSQAGRN